MIKILIRKVKEHLQFFIATHIHFEFKYCILEVMQKPKTPALNNRFMFSLLIYYTIHTALIVSSDNISSRRAAAV